MADEDEVDVVGEFDLHTQNELYDHGYIDNQPALMHCDEDQRVHIQCPDKLDKTSKTVIQNMLQEEKLHGLTKHYTISGDFSPNKTPWNDKEQELFIKGMALYGRKWSKISRMIGTRSVLQVRNFARQYFKKQIKENEHQQMNESIIPKDRMYERVIDGNLLLGINHKQNFHLKAAEVIHIQKERVEDSEEDIEVEDDRSDDEDHNNVIDKCTDVQNTQSERIHQDMPIPDRDYCVPKSETNFLDCNNRTNDDEERTNKVLIAIKNIDVENKTGINVLECLQNEDTLVKKTEIPEDVASDETNGNDSIKNSHLSENQYSSPSSQESISQETEKAYEPTNTNCSILNNDTLEPNIFNFIPPQHEIKILRDSISDEEKQIHHEFFENRPPKTPARYLKIRNYILEAWEKTKPNYLNKTSVRSGLRNCGDVNCIGRIHSYLEMIGAINFGCDQACYNRQANISLVICNRQKKKNEIANQLPKQKDNKRLRKRKLLNDDLEQGGGYTIQHKSTGDVIVQTHENNRKEHLQVRKPRNPFKLIPYTEFHKGFETPYEIDVFLEAVITMDLHAHCSRTEIIGLLGGHYDSNRRILYIKMAEPCQSLSTSMQCEMDPVSQTVASEFIQKRGLSVVGWYHSHPTFPPNPSLRDLETQAKYQEWFDQRHHPFIAIIINPYSVDVASKFRFMIVGQESIMNIYKKPYRLHPCFSSWSFVIEQCLSQAKKALQALTSDKNNIISLKSIYKPQPKYTYLEKIMKSIEHHINHVESSSAYEKFLEQLKSLILQTFEDLQNSSEII